MALKDIIVERGKRALQGPAVMRWVSDDRVMKAAEGVMDARSRVRAAWRALVNGHELPNIDPALDELPSEAEHGPGNGSSNGNGNGSAELRTSAAKRRTNGASTAAAGAAFSGNGSADMHESLKERSSLASIGGRDVFEKCTKFTAADNARRMGVYPYFRPLDLNDGPEAEINGRRVVMFGSNNYLGLTTHPKVRAAARAAIDRFGTSMTGSRLVNGSMKLHEEFEEQLAQWFGKESALVFTTGYQVNLATCCALLSNKQSVGLIDRNVHASLYDGV